MQFCTFWGLGLIWSSIFITVQGAEAPEATDLGSFLKIFNCVDFEMVC